MAAILALFIFATFILTSPHRTSAADSGSCTSGPPESTITNFDYVKYLERFGYTGYAVAHLPSGAPDEEIRSLAIQTFQANFGLAETGELNDETLFKMLIPRCGVTDITDGLNAMQLGNSPQKAANSSSAAAAAAMYDFIKGRPRWNYLNLSYVFMSNFPEHAKLDVEAAFDRWAGASPFTFYEVGTDHWRSDIVIGYFGGDHGDGYPFDGPRNVLAHAFPPSDGRMHFDAEENWSFQPRTTDFYHIETVALHEIGHLLGLGHTLVEEAVMYPSLRLHQFKELAEDDVDGINFLYPSL